MPYIEMFGNRLSTSLWKIMVFGNARQAILGVGNIEVETLYYLYFFPQQTRIIQIPQVLPVVTQTWVFVKWPFQELTKWPPIWEIIKGHEWKKLVYIIIIPLKTNMTLQNLMFNTHSIHVRYIHLHLPYPCMVYLPTFTININQM